jgi:phosphatidate phosphatase APP1
VLVDVDGTLNRGDEAMVTQMTLDAVGAARRFDAAPQKGVVSVCRAWAARGYQVVYLSGRQGGFYNHTRAWLVRHGFPPGPIALTEFTLLAALPGKARREAGSTSAPLCMH